MSIFKDWRDETDGTVFTYKVRSFLNPKIWYKLSKWRRQRADRGWSDRDTWGAGEHIAKMTAEMLQYLNDNTYVDWPEWFDLNVKEKNGYKNLQAVIDDINQYLEMTKQSWADDLTVDGNLFDDSGDGLRTVWRYKKTGRKLSQAQLSGRIVNWAKKENTSYNKAKRAMQFFSRHFAGFWD